MKKILASFFLLLLSGNVHAALNVFACEPEWAALTQQLAGDKANIYTATGPLQDPHQVQARPSLIAKARSAQLLVCTGAELEIGWMPVVLRESANSRIQPGSIGHFEAAQICHHAGSAYTPGSRRWRCACGGQSAHPDRCAKFLADCGRTEQTLIQLDPANTAYYQQRFAASINSGAPPSQSGKNKPRR